MSSENKKELLIVVFGGIFGLHKFIKGEIGKGLLYLFTAGLFFIGWIIDIIDVLKRCNLFGTTSLLGKEGIKIINDGKIPNIQGTNLNLTSGETCCYMDKAYTFKDKTITTGYTGKTGGFSIRIAKGLSYRTGGVGSKAIRETERTTYHGILYITSKRVIFTSGDESFDKPFDKITSIQESNDGVNIQIGSHLYSITVGTHSEFMKVFNLVKNSTKGEI